MLRRFYPTIYCRSIYDIDLETLRGAGIDSLVVDLDNTIVARNSSDVSEDLRHWLDEATNRGFKLCILSNNWQTRVSSFARQVDLPLVARAGKPRKKAFKQAIEVLGCRPQSVAVVGDQIFTDILGGNLMKLYTILVTPVSKHEAPHTRFLRRIERFILGHYFANKRARPNLDPSEKKRHA